jgi:Scd6-like Sm domain
VITLMNVRCHGTEDRVSGVFIPPNPNVYGRIMFKGLYDGFSFSLLLVA